MTKRKICAITERRADYSRLKPVLKAIQQSEKLELSVIVTGTHLLDEMGRTADLVRSDGFPVDAEVDMFTKFDQDNGASMSKALGRAIIGITDALEKIRPDVVLVGFDLGAHLAAAIAAAHMNIPVAHIQGGEVTGTIDESLRHAITKFAHMHFAATQDAADRIVKMGENPKYVFNVGCPVIDMIVSTKLKSKEELAEELKLDTSKPMLLIMQHPVTTEVDSAQEQIMKTLAAIRKVNKDRQFEVALIYSNIDAGGRTIIEEEKRSGIIRYKNLPIETFLGLLKITKVLIGNSSCGIREAPSFKVPAVNIGTRQQGRERAGNVIDVGYDTAEIVAGIRKALYDTEFRKRLENCKNPYGDGRAAGRIVKILEELEFPKGFVQKRIAY